NQTQASGNFAGITVNGTITTSGTGNISLLGKGGTGATSITPYGVLISGGKVNSTASGASAGSITITGTGGSGLNGSAGVRFDTSADITSVDGNVTITGTATASTGTFQ